MSTSIKDNTLLQALLSTYTYLLLPQDYQHPWEGNGWFLYWSDATRYAAERKPTVT